MARKVKLSKQEKIERDIRLQLRKQERAVEMQAKAAKWMKSSAIAIAGLHRQKARLEKKLADDLVASEALRTHRAEEAKAKEVEATIPLAKLGETEVGKANAASWNGAKPKRQRKPKAPIGSEARGLTLTPPQAKLDPTRMEALGFRKIGKKRKDPDAVAADREKQ